MNKPINEVRTTVTGSWLLGRQTTALLAATRALSITFCFLLVAESVSLAHADDSADGLLKSFLNTYCIRCHGRKEQKADRRFDELLDVDVSTEALAAGIEPDEAELLQEILDQLNLGEMPPSDEKQPTNSERKNVVKQLTRALNAAREAARENVGKVVMRRLNRVEYRNTVRDLFQLKMIDFDPTTTFPEDDPTDGFDNVGEGLVTSDFHLRNYLDAARKVADKAIRPGPRPEMIHYRMGGDADPVAREVQNANSSDKDGRADAGRLFIKFRQPLGLRQLDKKKGVLADGEYVIRFSARAIRRNSRYKDEDLRYNSREPMRLSISIDSSELGATAHRIIGEYEIPDNRAIDIEHRVWLEKGFTFHLHWANGPNGSFKRILRKVLPKYNKDALYPIRNPPEMYIGSGPELRVSKLEIEGPFYDTWPTPGFARFFPDPPEKPDAHYLEESLMRVATAAFRRPVSTEELEPYLNLSRRYLEEQRDFWAAAKYGVRAILTSPNFLYLAETNSTDSSHRKVNDHELAARLSYFLWSSMPDDELRAAADRGLLNDPKVLRAHAERMLSDSKSSSFVENFTGQWLGLRKLGEMPPDPEKNRAYYENNLEDAMRRETQMFFAHLLSDNRSILEFVDSKYTFLNKALARHYGIPEEMLHPNKSSELGFQRVSLRPEDHRGGLLGQASILTATSNGVETQPVLRGVWVLENLLGTPPSPPPPDIEPIEPDTRGVSTMRQLMERHRDNPTCYECHRKIDPIGLSMENFDHVGAWRDRYSKTLPIDSAGELPDGTMIAGASGIKKFLLDRPEQFTRCLTEKLFVYALGRRLSFADRRDIDRIANSMPKHNYGLRELIHQIVASEAFHIK